MGSGHSLDRIWCVLPVASGRSRGLEMLLNTVSCAIERQAWLSEGSILVVGPLIIIPTNVSKETGTAFFWHSDRNLPLKEFFTFRISLRTICAALARHHASESIFLTFESIPPISCCGTSWISLPSACTVRSGNAACTLSLSRVAFTFPDSAPSSCNLAV